MSSGDRLPRVDALVASALVMPAEARAAYLDRECGGDDDLRALVERRLESAADGLDLVTGGGLAALPAALESLALLPDPGVEGTLAGRYRIVAELGRGGMGIVYEAHDEQLERGVAIKVLSRLLRDDSASARFLREARAAAALNHPQVVAIHDFGEDDGRSFLVMELVEGPSLEERPPESIEETVRVARQICEALAHAHERGLVHRDLKPGNVLRAGDTVKLADMGIALLRDTARVTGTGVITGTPTFIAPEQAIGREVDGRADLYSLGVMLYLWLTGRPPFEGDDALAVVSQHLYAPVVPPRAHRPDIPLALEQLVMRLLEKEPEARPPDATRVAEELSASGGPQAGEPALGSGIGGLARGRMVGRSDELGRIRALWRAAGTDASRMVLISGEPGVGKTRLSREMVASVRLEGARVLSGSCYENEATVPYLPFIEAFRRVAREHDDAELARLLADGAPDIARLAPEIETRLGPFPARHTLSAQNERLRLFDHVARFLDRLGEGPGVLFFVDDLQWADHGSLALLHYLLREPSRQRLFFLGTYREVELDRAHPLARRLVDWDRERLATRLRLDRLTREQTETMLATLLGQSVLDRTLVDSLHRETEGNPFFVEEIVKALIADGGLVRQDSVWRRANTDEFIVPQSVKAAIGSRLERTGESCNEVLRVAAVLGKLFDFAELVSISGKDEDELLDALDAAVAAQLIVAGTGESFSFTHDKIREVLYEELNPIRRRRLHARIATALEQSAAAGGEVAIEELAHHFIASGDSEKGLVYSKLAAEAATRVYAWSEAVAMLERARDCALALSLADEIPEIDQSIGEATLAHGDIPSAIEHFERALEATDGDARSALRCKIGLTYVSAGDFAGREHARLAREALDVDTQPGLVAEAMTIEARYLHLEGHLEEAAQSYREAIALAEPLEDHGTLIELYSYLGGTLQHQARLGESDEMARRCQEIGRRHDLPEGVALGLEFLAENSAHRGCWQEAVDYGEEEAALARETHSGVRFAWSHFRAFALHPLGRLAEAETVFREGIVEGERTGDMRLALFMKMGLASCLVDRARSTEALELAESAVRRADERDWVSHRIAGRAHLVQVLLRRGRYEDASRWASEAVELWRASGSDGMGLFYGATLAEGLVRGERLEEARTALTDHARLAESNRAEVRRAQNLTVASPLASFEGRDDQAVELLGQALNILTRLSSPLAEIKALGERARLLRRQGRDEDAAADLERAARVLEGCDATQDLLVTL